MSKTAEEYSKEFDSMYGDQTPDLRAEKAAENLSKEAEKNDVTFICDIEWHC